MTGEVTIVALILHLLLIFDSTEAADKDRGHWGEWGPMSPCSVTCGSGSMKAERVWIPGPNEEKSIDGEPYTSTQVFSCTDETFPECPRDGSWSGWGAWSGCTKACGGGFRERHRECQGRMYGGKMCDGEKFDKEPCKREPCPALPRNFDMSQCNKDSNFTCVSKKMCIPLSQKCDSTVQCHDGSDEEKCPTKITGWNGVRYDLSKRNGAWAPISEAVVLIGSVLTVTVMMVLH